MDDYDYMFLHVSGARARIPLSYLDPEMTRRAYSFRDERERLMSTLLARSTVCNAD